MDRGGREGEGGREGSFREVRKLRIGLRSISWISPSKQYSWNCRRFARMNENDDVCFLLCLDGEAFSPILDWLHIIVTAED